MAWLYTGNKGSSNFSSSRVRVNIITLSKKIHALREAFVAKWLR
jgi:hypothetical protein